MPVPGTRSYARSVVVGLVTPVEPPKIGRPRESIATPSAFWPPGAPYNVDHCSEEAAAAGKRKRLTKAIDASTGTGWVLSQAPAVVGKSPE